MSDEKHECPSCERVFDTRQGLGLHHSVTHGEKLRVEVNCNICGKELKKKPSEAERSNTFLCSTECESKWKTGRRTGADNPSWSEDIELSCEWCGDDYQRRPSNADGSRYCSRQCQNEAQAERLHKSAKIDPEDVSVVCPTCDKGFRTESGMKSHHSQIHDESLAKPTTSGNLDCPADGCERSFDNDRGLKIHHMQVHGRTLCTDSCDKCGAEYNTVGGGRRFCSQECYGKWRSENIRGEDHPGWVERVTKVCKWCDEKYQLESRYAKSSRFCSRECVDKWRTTLTGDDNPQYKQVEKECEQCGDLFSHVPSRADSARFCSYDCRDKYRVVNNTFKGKNHPRWSGGVFPYGEGWTQLKRSRVRIRDQARCQHCGRTEPEHLKEFGTKHVVHHIRPARAFDSASRRNAMGNLVTLCRGECHWRWEQIAPLRPDPAPTDD